MISGNKDLAIKEFLNAVDINRETLDTYFALGGLFRSNGEIDKAISIHRSLIARENINESSRLRALKELAIDFDKGGFIDKAIETLIKGIKNHPDYVLGHQCLGACYFDIGDYEKAYSAIEKYVSKSRDNIRLQKLYAETCRKIGKFSHQCQEVWNPAGGTGIQKICWL